MSRRAVPEGVVLARPADSREAYRDSFNEQVARSRAIREIGSPLGTMPGGPRPVTLDPRRTKIGPAGVLYLSTRDQRAKAARGRKIK